MADRQPMAHAIEIATLAGAHIGQTQTIIPGDVALCGHVFLYGCLATVFTSRACPACAAKARSKGESTL